MRPIPKKLVALVGAAAAAALLSAEPKFEGTVLTAAPDPVGIVTACMGDTKDVRLGQHFTLAECDTRLEQRLAETAQEVDSCTPLAKMTTGQRVAAVDLAYNTGAGTYCHSGFARLIGEGRAAAACADLSNYVCARADPGKGDKSGPCLTKRLDKKTLPGLVKRRAWTRAICEGKTQ